MEAFDALVEALPEPTAILSADGTIHRVNRSFTRTFGGVPARGGAAANIVERTGAAAAGVLEYLRLCARTRQPVPGALTMIVNGESIPCRAEGWTIVPRTDDRPALVALRLSRRLRVANEFLDLTRRIGDLTAEVARRRTAEIRAAAAAADLTRTQERLALLTEATDSLLGSLTIAGVLESIGTLTIKLLPADAHAVWCFESATGVWRTHWHRGLSAGFMTEISGWSGSPAGEVPFDSPLPIADVAEIPLLAERRTVYEKEGIASLLVIPLRVHGANYGTAVAYYAATKQFSDADVRVATALGNMGSAALTTAGLYGEARQANQLKDEFLATLSHELRTPLNAILGYTRMLRSGALAEERRPSALDVVERNAMALHQIVEDVLDVSRIIAGKVRLNMGPVDMAAVLRDAVATTVPAADAKGVQLETIVEPGLPSVPGDPDRLQQVLWNLLSNAVKFTPRGGRVEARLQRTGPHVEAVVADNGSGISPDFLPHIFERFRQGNAGVTREHGGLGLGLAIARHLVELHGGDIAVASDGEGKGATFRVRLPALTPAPELAGAPSLTEPT